MVQAWQLLEKKQETPTKGWTFQFPQALHQKPPVK